MKKTFLLLFGFFCIFSLYGTGTVDVKPGVKIRKAKLNQLLGSITKIDETKIFQEQLEFFCPITFGYNPIFADHVFDSELHPFSIDRKTASRGNIHLFYINQGLQLVSDVANSDNLYFVIPNSITSKYSLSVSSDNKQYSPVLIKNDGSYSMFGIKKEIKSVKDNQEIKFVFFNKSGELNDKIQLTYLVTPIEKGIFEKTVTALDSLDKSIENPQLAYNLGSYLYRENYKSLNTDKITGLYESLRDEFNNSEYDLFNSKFALYENDSFIIGLKSIYLSSINETATFNSMGDIIVSEQDLKISNKTEE